ncbi:TPA: hypothetical protein ACH3X2_012930 [Trebouxia sp. C0005]
MARRSGRHSKSSASVQSTGDAARDVDEDDLPIAQLTVRSPRRTPRVANRKLPTEALQKLTSLRKHSQHKAQACARSRSNRALAERSSNDLNDGDGNNDDFQQVSADQRRASRILREASSSDKAAASVSHGSPPPARRQSSRQAAQMPLGAQRCSKSKFVTGSARRSMSGSDGDDLEGFLASESDEEVRPPAKRSRMQKSGQQRTARAKLDWSDSSSESHGKISRHEPAVRNATHTMHGRTDDDDAPGALAMQDDEEVPQPARRHRQVSHIMGYEEDWEEAEGAHMAAKVQPPQAEAATRRSQQLQDHAEDQGLLTRQQRHLATGSGDDEDAAVPAPASVKRKRVVLLEDDDDGQATDEAAEHPRRGRAQQDASADMSSDDDAQAELQSPAARLAEEGLDPVEQLDVPQSQRRSRGQQAGAGSIRDRIQQNQQRVREGQRRRRQAKADPFLDNRIKHVWDGSNFCAPTDTDSQDSHSQTDSASSNSQEGSADSAPQADDDSDLQGFIVDDPAELAGDDPHAAAGSAVADGAESSGQEARTYAASTALQEAGFRSHQSDRDCFASYIEYIVYDLVDKTFAVRLRGDRLLNQQYQQAMRKIEEKLSERRELCVVSSAWSKAVDGLLDNVDTYPGMSSDWADEGSSLGEAQDGMCQACQKGQTAGHAVKTLTLKGRPYQRLWKYGFRRVSNAHVRRDLPLKEEEEDYGVPAWQEMRYAVGKYCCARLQLYHALMHYKHRLRGKLKKRIKREHNVTRLRGEAGVDPWVEAAKRVAANTAIRDSLFKHYVALVDLATNYNTQDRSNSWRKDQSYIGAQVDKLMYQLNSDSEGDEGSDINPELEEEEQEEEEDAQGSESGEDHDPQTASTAVHAEADKEAADKAGATQDAGPMKRALALAGQITATAEAGAALPRCKGTKAEKQAAEEAESRVSVVGSAIQDPIDIDGQVANLPDKQPGIKSQECLAAPTGRLPEQSLQADTLPYDVPQPAAEQATLAYSPAPDSRPLEAAELTLPSDAADGGPRSDSAEQQTLCYGPCGAAGEGEQAPFSKTGKSSCLCKWWLVNESRRSTDVTMHVTMV